jgi:hypothetical protein
MPQPGPMELKPKNESKMDPELMGTRLQRKFELLEIQIKKLQNKEIETGNDYRRAIAKLRDQQKELEAKMHPRYHYSPDY